MNELFYGALAKYNTEMKKINDIYRCAIKRFMLSDCAFWILYTLRIEQRSFTQSEIGDYLCEPKQTINSALKKLEANNYIALSPGNDQRSKKVSLTEAGEALAQKTVDKLANAETKALCRMSADDCDAFIRLTKLFGTMREEETNKMEE